MNLTRIGIPPCFLGATTKNIKITPDQYEILKQWAIKPQGNIVLTGQTGRGKTYAAVALMYFFNSIRKIDWHDQRFVEVADFNQFWLSNIHQDSAANFDKAYILKNCKVLVLDDLGTRKPSEGFLDYLFTIINHRCNDSNLITIYTTNLNARELNENLGARIVSRIGAGCVVKFEGADLRRKENQVELHLKKCG